MAVRNLRSNDYGFYQIYETDECDKVNPYEYFKTTLTEGDYHRALFDQKLLNKPFTERIIASSRARVLSEAWYNEKLISFENTIIQDELQALFVEKKKKAQLRLIKAIRWKSIKFVALPMYAWREYRLPYSRFWRDHLPKELNNKTIPTFLNRIGEDEFEYMGYTDLSAGQMKAAFEKRNRVIADFIGDDHHWYCFFRTMAGIKGYEHPHEGFPHIHFISSAWGIAKNDVIENLMSYRYNLNAETIPFDSASSLD